MSEKESYAQTRINEAGLEGLADKPRPGRERIYANHERGEMVGWHEPIRIN